MRGEFIGFTYNGIHSEELGVIRTSSGDRFETIAAPELKDKTVVIPGSDETVYFGTEINSSKLSLKIALDGISEVQMNQIKQKWLDKKIHPLIFDEYPFKAYYAKVANSSIRFTCLDDGKGQRIYYGTGNLDFVCNYPYALGLYKDSEEFFKAYEGRYDLIEGGVLPASAGWVSQNIKYSMSNTGDLDMDFKIIFTFENEKCAYEVESSTEKFYLKFEVDKKNEDVYVQYDSKTQNLTGLDSNQKPTGTFYSIEKLTAAKVLAGESLQLRFKSSSIQSTIGVEYNYIYY